MVVYTSAYARLQVIEKKRGMSAFVRYLGRFGKGPLFLASITYLIPTQFLLPLPNATRNFSIFLPLAVARVQREGSKVEGEGKMLGSMRTK
jgi:hypothetical protein